MSDHPRLCTCGNLPLGGPPPDPNAGPRAGIIFEKWSNGETLRVGFLDGRGDPWSEEVRQTVREVAPEWSKYANIHFKFIEGFGDITISFRDGAPGTYNSELGTRSRRVSGQGAPSMRLVFDPRVRSNPDHIHGTILHEFGHALGLIHEHHRPDRPFVWNESVVIQQLSQPLQNGGWGWSPEMIRHQMLAPTREHLMAVSEFDKDSIMIYPIQEGFAQYADGSGSFVVRAITRLSERDKEFIARMYPYPPGTGGKTAGGTVVTSTGESGRTVPRSVNVGEQVSDSLGAGQVRWYTFTVPEGMVSVRTDGAQGVLGAVYGPNDRFKPYRDLSQAADNRNVESIIFLEATTWFLKVWTDKPDGGGNYTLSINPD